MLSTEECDVRLACLSDCRAGRSGHKTFIPYSAGYIRVQSCHTPTYWTAYSPATVSTFDTRIRERLTAAREQASDGTIERCADYLQLLAKWNRTINLTAFDLDRATDAAIDRLIIESLLASAHVDANAQQMIDIGSGSGSPALPMMIARNSLRGVLVESKTRKAAFLREAIRALDFRGATVETIRAEELPRRTGLRTHVDLVTMRAVQMNDPLSTTIATLLRPDGRLFWFTSSSEIPKGFRQDRRPFPFLWILRKV